MSLPLLFTLIILVILLLVPVVLMRVKPTPKAVEFKETDMLESIPTPDSVEFKALQQYYQHLAAAGETDSELE